MYMPAFEKLKTENKEELLKLIKATRIKMGRLKAKMEHPDYKNKKEKVCPSDLVIYKCDRDFLNSAILQYLILGGEYLETKLSLRDSAFNDKLKDIEKITFYSGGFFSTNEKTVIDLSGDELKVMISSFSEVYERITEISKEEFIYQLGELHIGEWRSCYSTKRFGIEVCDGVQWALKLEYKDGKKKTYGGDNAFPYNFDELLDLLANV